MKNLVFNLGASFVSFFITALISFWMTPFIISNLGAEAYGFIPLTQNLISVLTILTIALSSVIARFFTVSITRGGILKAQGYFNTYLVASLFGSIIIMSIIITLTFFIENLINIPDSLVLDVKLAILFSGIMIVFSLFQSLFVSAPFSQNKVYLIKVINVLNAIVKGLLTFLLLIVFTPKIWYVNLGAMIAIIFSLLLSIAIFKKLIPTLKIKFTQFSFEKLKELMSAGIWVSIGQVGVILFLGTELLVANLTLGPAKAGIYAAMIQFPLLLRNISNSISVVFAPVIIKKYANNDLKGLLAYSNKSVKLNGLLIVLPAAILCSYAEPVLNLWLGKEFISYKWILILSAGYLVFTLSPLPLSHVFTAVNKLKIPGITTIIFGLINLILAFILSGYTSLELYGIVIAGAIGLMLKNTFFNPYYCSVITKQSIFVYYRGMLEPIIGAAFIIIISIILQNLFEIQSWFNLISMLTIVSVCYLAFVFVLLLSKKERYLIINAIRNLLAKK
ncbi:MATE family efflux transporter [Cerasibacillus terrae]|uniref:MATE family efflux transporter n=1 Tax=Cerasibacillus terrae TaxID=2498845 RepID=A0A5C8P0F5_9BACI|nr:MATE family efflux transporter [Cerasibacillus terrae]TXL66777.1 MATE family efflux transporter [Cerasibacillus terrae]